MQFNDPLSLLIAVKVKELEQELKSVKKSYDTKLKKIEKKVPIECENSKLIEIKNIFKHISEC